MRPVIIRPVERDHTAEADHTYWHVEVVTGDGEDYELTGFCPPDAVALIAAAPDLYSALSGFVLNRANLKTEEPFEGALARLLDLAAAAIAKAEAQQ